MASFAAIEGAMQLHTMYKTRAPLNPTSASISGWAQVVNMLGDTVILNINGWHRPKKDRGSSMLHFMYVAIPTVRSEVHTL